MKSPQSASKQAAYKKNTYKEPTVTKNTYYTNNTREQQKMPFNYIEETKLRIIQDNLVSVSGLPTEYDNMDLLCDNQHFGKYGTVNKVIISTQGKNRSAFIQVYITYENSSEAAFTIKAMDGIKISGRDISATFGTTKYCTYFLRQNECRNQKCFYLHQYDTKNEITDGVKNNLGFLDDKAEEIIRKNLKYYIQRQKEQTQQKQDSQFPTIRQTLQYLIDEGVFKQQIVKKLRKQVENQVKSTSQKKITQLVNEKSFDSQKQSQVQSLQKDEQSYEDSISKSMSDRSNAHSLQEQRNRNDKLSQDYLIQQTLPIKSEQSLMQVKNRKCNSLATAPSPTKYQKMTQMQQQNIDRTIQKRIIKQIMKNKLIFKSKMDFVPHIPTKAKQQNNKIKNYVRKHLLNQI